MDISDQLLPVTAETGASAVLFEEAGQPTGPRQTITIEQVTPELAAELLMRNVRNRPMSQTHVHFLSRQMQEGKWQLTYDPIQISITARLLNGQHRLAAIVKSGTTQPMMIVWDLPDETFAVMDTGRMRMAADVLDIADVPNARQAASTVRMIINYQRGIISGTLKNQGRGIGQAVTHTDILAFAQSVDIQPYLLKAKVWYKEWRMFTGSEYGFIYYTLSQLSADHAETFLSTLARGANLDAESPIFLLRKKMEQYKLNKISCTPSERLALTIKAWNLYRKNATVRMLHYNPEREEFPLPL